MLLFHLIELDWPVMMVEDHSCGVIQAKRLGKIVLLGIPIHFIGQAGIFDYMLPAFIS